MLNLDYFVASLYYIFFGDKLTKVKKYHKIVNSYIVYIDFIVTVY